MLKTHIIETINKILLTLWRLDVSVAEVRPCLRDADVRIHLLNATVKIDGSAGVLQVVTRVVDVDAVVLVSQVSLYLVPSVPELWLVRSINTDLWLVNITCSLLADGWPAPESSSSCPGMTWCCPPPSSDCSPHHHWPGQYPSSPLYTQRLVNNHQQSWLTCCKYTQRWLSWVPQSQPELSQDSSSWSPGDESHWHSSPTQTAALWLVNYYINTELWLVSHLISRMSHRAVSLQSSCRCLSESAWSCPPSPWSTSPPRSWSSRCCSCWSLRCCSGQCCWLTNQRVRTYQEFNSWINQSRWCYLV